jgi:uncharacterized surface protein with fasciclin (FAS1) repeats
VRSRAAVLGAVLAVSSVLAACSSDSKSSSSGTTSAGTSAGTTSASTSSSAATSAAPASTLFGSGCATLGLTAATTAAAANLPVGTVASATPFLKNTVAAATAAGILATLDAAPAITVFVPTDDAFAKEPAGELQSLLTNPALKPQLIAILQYGVLPGTVDKSTLAGAHVTQQGQSLTITGSGDDFTVNGTAKILCGGLQTKNAVVYVVDAVLKPTS